MQSHRWSDGGDKWILDRKVTWTVIPLSDNQGGVLLFAEQKNIFKVRLLCDTLVMRRFIVLLLSNEVANWE